MLDIKYDAIYARQSVDRVDSISIESQIEFCKREALGKIEIYADKGYSGKNTDRPEWQRLLADIKQNKVQRVITYRLDRISRSVLDFANIIDTFEEYHVDFISTMEKFDTGTPIGKAMVMIVMVFAQLERETIQQRVLDAYKSRSAKGFYMGGRVPYGFKLTDTFIDGIRTKMYEPDEGEKKIVQLVFEMYSRHTVSLGDVVKHLREIGVQDSNRIIISRPRIRDIICNPIYLKADQAALQFFKDNDVEIVNSDDQFIGTNGCYLYQGGPDAAKSKKTGLYGSKLVIAPHEGFISSDVWLTCRKKCLTNRQQAKPTKAKRTWLAGKVKCANCGYALTAKLNMRRHKEPYEFLVCQSKYNKHNCDGVGAIYLKDVQDAVFEEMKKKLEEFKVLYGEASSGEDVGVRVTLERQIDNKEAEVAHLVEQLCSMSGAAVNYVNAKINQLVVENEELETQLKELLRQHEEVHTDAISNYLDMWDEVSFDDKRAVVDALIESVHVGPGSIKIKWKF